MSKKCPMIESIDSHLSKIEERVSNATQDYLVMDRHYMYPEGPLIHTVNGAHVAAIIGTASEPDGELFVHARDDLRRLILAVRSLVDAYDKGSDKLREEYGPYWNDFDEAVEAAELLLRTP